MNEKKEHIVILGLGSNVEPRISLIKNAIELIKINYETSQEILISSVYETEPWGFYSNDKFLNLCIQVFTQKNPQELLKINQSIERKLGREQKKTEKYESRPIDIDILFFDDKIISENNLIIPHPQIENRKFVLKPLCDLISDYYHPVLNKMIKDLSSHCSDDSEPILYSKNLYL